MRTTNLSKTLILLPMLITAGCLEKGAGEGGGSISGSDKDAAPWQVADGGYEEEFDRSHAPSAGDGLARGGAGGAAMGMADADMAAEGGGAAPPAEDVARPVSDDGEAPVAPDPGHQAGLEGGEIDDNELWDEYLAYIRANEGLIDSDPALHYLDVSDRYFIRVTDSTGATVPGAQVRVIDPVADGQGRDSTITSGLTLADGRLPFHPRAHGYEPFGYDVRVTVGNLLTEATLDVRSLTTEIELDGPAPEESLKLDIAFVIDSTGSMGEEIARIQQTILDIAAELKDSEFEPDLRMGLVEYRDRGDEFLTHTVNLTSDVESFEAAVAELRAGGGGDFPEDMNAALERTMNRLEWREGRALRLVFVVADAPPHHYDDANYTYDHAMLDAHEQGIKIIPVASGGSDGTAEFVFRQLAQFTLGKFVFITEGGGSSHGSGGSDYDVNEADFQVEKLDKLIVRLVSEEMADWTGR